jgi:hypothetical protein
MALFLTIAAFVCGILALLSPPETPGGANIAGLGLALLAARFIWL